jgi:hypothetical protein
LKELVWNYNHRENRSILMAPAEADETTGLFFKELQYAEAQKQYERLRVGDTVRKQIHKKKGFDKGRARWSQALYTITGKEHNHYVLSDGSTAKHYHLQRVAGVQKTQRPDRDVERTAVKKDKKVTRDLRKEGVGRYQEAGGRALVGLGGAELLWACGLPTHTQTIRGGDH